MGRPNTCQTCCTDLPDDPRPASECETLICVALIDENDKESRTTFEAKMIKWIEAYPNRLLFVMDVTGGNMYYPSSFIAYDKAFSYAIETGQYVVRDNGNLSIRTDVWDKITTIVNSKSTAIQNLFSAAKEVSIFIDDSGSMTVRHVLGAVALLKTEIVADGKRVVGSITNKREDVICPFVLEQCCTSEAASDLRVLCGLDACSPTTLLWGLQPNGAFVVDDPCSPAGGDPHADTCQSCPEVKTTDHTAKYKAYVKAADGQILDYPTINYTIQARDGDSDWKDIYGLPDGLSNAEQSLEMLIKYWQVGGKEQVGQILSGDFINHNFCQTSLNADGTTVAVGTTHYPCCSSTASGRGQVKIYDYDPDRLRWVQRGDDILGIHTGLTRTSNSQMEISISDDGNTVAIGYRTENNPTGTPGYDAGAVKVFKWQNLGTPAWVQMGSTVYGADGLYGDWFGHSISLHPNGLFFAALGGRASDQTPTDDIRVYEWNSGGSTWDKVGIIDKDLVGVHTMRFGVLSLQNDGPRTSSTRINDNHGLRLAIVSDVPSRVFVINYGTDGNWHYVGGCDDDDSALIGTGSTTYSRKPSSAALRDDGLVVAVGAEQFNGDDGLEKGHVRVFGHRIGAGIDEWVQIGNDILGSNDTQKYAKYRFGNKVKIDKDGKTLLITSETAYKNVDRVGSVSVYKWHGNKFVSDTDPPNGTWVQVGDTIIGPHRWAQVGSHIDISNNGSVIAVGQQDYHSVNVGPGNVTVYRTEAVNSNSNCHPLIDAYGGDGSCEEYTDVPVGNNCSRRVFKREFRIKAKTYGLDAIYSNVFKLYKYIYQKAIDSGSGKWVPAGRSEQYIHRSWWETDNNNIKMSNGSQWGTANQTATYRHVQVQVAGGAETNKGISEMFLVGENGNKYVKTDNPPLAQHRDCQQTGQDNCDLPHRPAGSMDSYHYCSGLPKVPIDNSSNDRFSAFFLPSGVHNQYATARATLGAAFCTRAASPTEATVELLIGEPTKHYDDDDHWQRNPGGLDGIKWDLENVICINPTLPSPSLPTSSLAIRYSTEKPHIIALAAKRDLYGTPGFAAEPFQQMVNFYQLRPVNISNTDDLFLPLNPLNFEWALSDSTAAYRSALKTTMQCVKLLMSEDGSTCVAIYHRYYEGEYGWANSEGHWTNTNAIATVFKIENDNSGHAKSSVLYAFDMKRFRLSHATSWSTGAALSFDGKRLVVELHTTTEDIENLDQGSNRWKKSRMDATGAVNELCVIELTPTAPKLIATLDLRSSVLPSPEKGSAEDYLFRSLTANHDCSKFSIVKNIRPNLPSAATSAGLPLQKGVIETYSFDGSAIKLIGTFQELGMASHNEQYPWSHFTNDQHTPSPENVRARDFRGDISMSADGKYLHAYTRARTHNKATTDSTFFDYYNMSSYHWDAS